MISTERTDVIDDLSRYIPAAARARRYPRIAWPPGESRGRAAHAAHAAAVLDARAAERQAAAATRAQRGAVEVGARYAEQLVRLDTLGSW